MKSEEIWSAPAIVSFLVLCLVALGWPPVREGYTDFLSFYAGARLAGTPHLYSIGHVQDIQKELSRPEEVRAYIRPPVYAMLLWPLGRLPYQTAHVVWQLLNLAALAGFLWLGSRSALGVVMTCWYFPLWLNYTLAQDIPLLLFAIAAAARLLRKDRNFAAGLVFAFCGIKFHLFLLIPLFILARKLWRFAAGLAAGGAAMLAVSFAVLGQGWPAAYYEVLKGNEQAQASQRQMANLLGLLFGIPGASIWLVVLAVAVGAAAWYIARRSSLDHALACVLHASLLASPHAFSYDCALLLPLFISLTGRVAPGKALFFSMATGASAVALALPKLAFAGQLALLILFGYVVYEAHRADRPCPAGTTTGACPAPPAAI